MERLSGYELRHGEAVACGLVAAARLAEALGCAEDGLTKRVADALTTWGLPTTIPAYPVPAILDAMTHDKKKQQGQLRWILPRRIGEVEIVEDVSVKAVEDVLEALQVKG
jgi:3-dehydroquinate synthetase